MFWSGNYVVVGELKLLLKKENVTLAEVLEADDILQECKSDNKDLIKFVTQPEILAELITLITEEPSKDVELSAQYRLATIACEVLTSQMATLSDHLSSDVVQMNRLCDFINREPPLNPLLASFFSKTIEMLLQRSFKQDGYLYHIVCLRVLDFFTSRREFLPNLLRHLATSAISDTFKYFMRLDHRLVEVVIEWLEEHQFLEALIQILCGTYVPEELQPCASGAPAEDGTQQTAGADRQTNTEDSAKVNSSVNHSESDQLDNKEHNEDGGAEQRRLRLQAVASDNVASLLCDIVRDACVEEACSYNGACSGASGADTLLVAELRSAPLVRSLLAAMFTSPPHCRARALVNGGRVLHALLLHHHTPPLGSNDGESYRSAVELAAAPHLPLLHQALLQSPDPCCVWGVVPAANAVGAARLKMAELVAALAASEVHEVATTLVTLGTPGTLVDLMFRYPDNNFLHSATYATIRAALNNQPYDLLYAKHLLIECDLLTRVMDAFEAHDSKQGSVRPGYMGHLVLVCRLLSALEEAGLLQELQLQETLVQRWAGFRRDRLEPLLRRLDTPLGGSYPSQNIYEFSDTAGVAALQDYRPDEINDVGAGEMGGEMAGEWGGDDEDSEEKFILAKNSFLSSAQERFKDDMWDEVCGDGSAAGALEGGGGEGAAEEGALGAQTQQLFDNVSPWDCNAAQAPGEAGEEGQSGEGWAQFSNIAVDQLKSFCYNWYNPDVPKYYNSLEQPASDRRASDSFTAYHMANSDFANARNDFNNARVNFASSRDDFADTVANNNLPGAEDVLNMDKLNKDDKFANGGAEDGVTEGNASQSSVGAAACSDDAVDNVHRFAKTARGHSAADASGANSASIERSSNEEMSAAYASQPVEDWSTISGDKITKMITAKIKSMVDFRDDPKNCTGPQFDDFEGDIDNFATFDVSCSNDVGSLHNTNENFGSEASKSDNLTCTDLKSASTYDKSASIGDNFASTNDKSDSFDDNFVSTDDKAASIDVNFASTNDKSAGFDDNFASADDKAVSTGSNLASTSVLYKVSSTDEMLANGGSRHSVVEDNGSQEAVECSGHVDGAPGDVDSSADSGDALEQVRLGVGGLALHSPSPSPNRRR